MDGDRVRERWLLITSDKNLSCVEIRRMMHLYTAA